MIGWIVCLVALVGLSACAPADLEPKNPGAMQAAPAPALAPVSASTAATFEYYVLALSWSPTYCADPENADRDRLQCDGRRPFAFVTHGLWPQYETGFPENCETRFRTVSDAVQDGMLDIMPSRGLIRHQWRKHGACTGMEPGAYFALVRDSVNMIAIPPAYRGLSQPLRVTGAAVEMAFIDANPGLRADGVAVQCRGGRLREVRLCVTRQGEPRACGADVRDACSGTVTILPVRGRGGQ
jgi:ribonuclease T2